MARGEGPLPLSPNPLITAEARILNIFPGILFEVSIEIRSTLKIRV